MKKFRIPDMNRQLHVSWLIAWCGGGIVGGIAIASALPSRFTTVQLGLIAFSLLAVGLYKRTVWAIGFVVLAGCCIGFVRGSSTIGELSVYDGYIGKSVQVQGVVGEDASFANQGEQRIKLRDVQIGRVALPGQLWVSTSPDVVLRRSDNVIVSGVLSPGFGTIPASMFDANIISAKRTRHGDIALESRDWFAAGVRRAIDEPQASLGVGFLLGQRSSLPENLDAQLRLLGLTHIVVASGYNLTILVRFARRGLAKKSKYLALLGSTGFIVGFVLMTGLSPSMSRAALVAGISLLAWYFGRTIQPIIILAISSAITSLINPSYVWGDLGWYLSFLSFAGIMLLAPLIQHYFWGPNAQLGVVRRIVIETMSAQLATLPLIAWVFGQYSVLSLPANVLVLPLVPLAMAFTFAAGIGAVSLPSVAWFFGIPAGIVLLYMTTITGWLAHFPWASADVHVGVQLLIAGYIALFTAGFYLWKATKHRFSNDNIVV